MVKKCTALVKVISVLAILSFIPLSCKMGLVEKDGEPVLQETGSLVVTSGNGNASRSLDVSELTYAKAFVSGYGISEPISSEFFQMADGSGNITVNGIPVGANRIVTVQAYDSEKNAVTGAIIRAVVDITSNVNSCSVNQKTTAGANFFTKLLSLDYDISSITDAAFEAVENFFEGNTISWALLDTDSLASDYISDSSVLAKKSLSDYKLETGSVSITSSITNAYSVRITDPSSKVEVLSSSNTITSAAPGNWKLQVLSGKTIVASETIKVVSGETTSVSVNESVGGSEDLTGKTIIFVKANSAPTIWAWEIDGVALSATRGDDWNNPTSAATLVPATSAYMSDYSGWYMVDYSDIASGKDIHYKLNRSEPEISASAGCSWYTSGTSASSTNPSPAVSNGEPVVTITVTNPVIPDEDSITVHAKQAYIYYWTNTVAGVSYAMTDEGNGWFKYTIPLTSCNIIFKDDAAWTNKTADLSRSEPGEYWYKGGKWYEVNPDDDVVPVLSSFTANKSGTVSGEVTFTVTASDNLSLSKAVITSGTKVLGTVELSGKSDTKTFVWDTTLLQNASYTVKCTVFDAAGNEGESKSLNFTTSNANLPPVAVISGAGSVATGSEKTYSALNSYDQNGGTIKSYKWSVSGAIIKSGDGTDTITLTMPSVVTTVTVSLTVTDNDGASSSTVSKKVNVVEQDPNWDFRDESIYFVMTTRFYDGDKSNNEYCWDEGGEYLPFGSDADCAWRGDFKGLAEKLDYIKALGFSAIWITPVVQNASGIDYHGYHAYDFSKVDPRYESTDYTYQDFINDCHAKGIKVIQDIVLNHTGNFGEKNLFHMFDKDSTPYQNPDIKTPTSIPRSPFMVVAEDGNAYSKLQSGMTLRGIGSTTDDYNNAIGGAQYDSRINAMKEDSIDTDLIYHHAKQIDWNSENCQLGQMAGDCVDLNTENPVVFKYLTDCYNRYIDMGVDAFRIDTVKHISRYTFNKEFIPAFMERGGEKFYIFGETCARYRGRWNEGVPALSPAFYTWKETENLPWSQTDSSVNSSSATAHFEAYKSSFAHPAWSSGIANHLLNGNEYHKPDYSYRSYLDQIDFPMHWAFSSAGDAFGTAVHTNDPDFNDATWNVTYVDSHDYAPDNAPEDKRFNGYWPDKLNLIFTFRGIPCIYYGSEIEFKKGLCIDPANGRVPLEDSGRAYFGDYLEGTVTATDYGEYTASGAVQTTLNHELAQHIRRLNQIRRAIPALRKGQYSTEGCSGSIAFKRRYTDDSVDSFALVAINGGATFSGIPSGDYVEVITGKTVSSNGSLTTDSIGEGNMRVYVLKTSTCEVTGKIGSDGAYLK